MKKRDIPPDCQRRVFALRWQHFYDGRMIFLLFVTEQTLATAARIPATTGTNILVPDVGRLEVCCAGIVQS